MCVWRKNTWANSEAHTEHKANIIIGSSLKRQSMAHINKIGDKKWEPVRSNDFGCGSGSGYNPKSGSVAITKNKDANGFVTYKNASKVTSQEKTKKNPSPYITPNILFGLAGKDDFWTHLDKALRALFSDRKALSSSHGTVQSAAFTDRPSSGRRSHYRMAALEPAVQVYSTAL
jgi:hypothetical protein